MLTMKRKDYMKSYMTNRYRRDKKFREKVKKTSILSERKRRKKWIKQGLCSKCGGTRKNKNFRTCEKCRM